MLTAGGIAALALCLAACSKGAAVQGEFWVAGLTLPPGSEIVTKHEIDDIGDQPYVPTMGKADRALTIGFNNPGGWDLVKAHVDGCMRKQGYSETMDEAKQSMSKIPGGAEMLAEADGMRMYMKRGTKISVMLMDNSDFAGTQDPGALAQMGLSQFDLYITQFK